MSDAPGDEGHIWQVCHATTEAEALREVFRRVTRELKTSV